MNVPQQDLTETIWNNHAQNLRVTFVRIIGRVIGEVRINDINKKVVYNQVLDINSDEAKSSKDLQDAFNKRWIDIVQGKEFLDADKYTTSRQIQPPQQQPRQPVQVVQQKIDLTELKNLIVQTTKSTIQDEMGNAKQPDVDQIADAIANKINISQGQSNKIDEESTSVFIDVNEEKSLRTNIDDDDGLGVVTTQSSEKAKHKIKKIKRLKMKLK